MFLRRFAFLIALALVLFAVPAWAQSYSTIQGTVKDPSGASVPAATVNITDPVSGFHREAMTGIDGSFQFTNVPFNPYHLVVTATGFAAYNQDVDLRSAVPASLQISLTIGASSESVTVEATGTDLVETEPTPHTDIDRDLIDKLPLESASSEVSSLVTLSSPGVVADSNGLFHGLGDHAENSFSVDGQPITDQQSKVFSNQIPADAVQSMEVIEGAPPAEYGGKTSLIINVTTRSGLDQKRPTGSVTTSYGTFGTANTDFNLAYGGTKWGNFVSISGLNTGRFLDPPEFQVFHDKGNEQNGFDRFDLQPTGTDSIHLNFNYTRSWFQTPNSFDAQFHPCDWYSAAGVPAEDCNASNTLVVNPVTGVPLGPSDQRSKIETIDFSPSWDHIINNSTVTTVGFWVRRDHYDYYPSSDPFNDFSSALQSATAGQDRILLNTGVRADVSYVKGINNIKLGGTFEHTFLTENDTLGIVDPNFLGGLGITCPGAPACPYDLTAGGTLFHFNGSADIKEIALYLQDTITKGAWSFNLGIRGDLYRGFLDSNQAEPRAGISYNIKKTNTVLRISYARLMDSPFNENLIVASIANPVTDSILGAAAPVPPGYRNDFHAGFEQAIGKWLVINADYMWKYTHNGYDFSVLFNTPITFPVAWHNSKLFGPSFRVTVPNFHGFTAYLTGANIAARFFTPQVGGLGTDVTQPVTAFRIDHDEKYEQNVHAQYQPRSNWPWIGFTWRYDSGLVAGAAPCFNLSPALTNGCATSEVIGGVDTVDLTYLSADQQLQMGLFCGNAVPTMLSPILTCPASQLGSTRVSIPAPGTEDEDANPKRTAPRHLFDASVGDDNVFHGDRYKWSARITVINLTNKVALYNFLSTFSGTHFVTPRTVTGELGFHF